MNICVMNTVIENITDVRECEINQSINHCHKVGFAYAVIAHSNEQTFSFHLADNKKGEQLESKTRISEPVNHPEQPKQHPQKQ